MRDFHGASVVGWGCNCCAHFQGQQFSHSLLPFHRPGTHLIRQERTQAASDGLQEEN